MNTIITILIIGITSALFAQGPNTDINKDDINKDDNHIQTNANDAIPKNKLCKDCDEVKQAIKVSHASSGGSYQRKSFSMKKWSRAFSGKMHMKMKKTFARKYKGKTSYALCFNWH